MAQLITTDSRKALIGIGVTGYSVARHFQSSGKDFDVFDTRPNPPGVERFRNEFPQARINLGEIAPGQLNHYREIILSPGLDPQSEWLQKAVSADTEIMGDIDLFARLAEAPIVGITGSNAKSTVTTLVGLMAEAAGLNVGVGGNLGTAALDLLNPERQLYVLELSSFQLELVNKLQPAVACILNMSPDHMDRYPSMIAYHAAKQRIYAGAEKLVFNRDDALTQPLIQEGQTAVSFGMDAPDLNQYGLVVCDGETCLARGREVIMHASELALKGRHNLANTLAAFALAEAVNIPLDAMKKAAKEFTGLPHRCQFVAEKQGVTWINDSKATNIGATGAALSGFGAAANASGTEPSIILIAGGQGKGQNFAELAPLMAGQVKQLILIGEDADQIARDIEGAVPCVLAFDLNAAVQTASDFASEGDTVLLSPACASFDMFSGYEERGSVFAELVNQHVRGTDAMAQTAGQANE